jgi:hypothetical protein
MTAEKRKGVGSRTQEKKEQYKITQLRCTEKIQTNKKIQTSHQKQIKIKIQTFLMLS